MSEARPDVLTEALKAKLAGIAVSTIVGRLHVKHGIRNSFFAGLKPMVPGVRMVGRARTLRYVAVREDRARSIENAQRKIMESVNPDEVIVIEARGVTTAATFGDLLAGRAFHRGAVGIVTDGTVRDTPAIAALGKPIFYPGTHSGFMPLMHMPLEIDVPITCAGIYVEPGDIIVGDDEGAAVLPVALAAEVAEECIVQELEEKFAEERIAAGDPLNGIFPLTDARRADFNEWKAARGLG